MKAQYHPKNDNFRVVQRGKLFFAQQRMHEKGRNKGKLDGENHVDTFEDMHRGTDEETARLQVSAAVERAKG